jgi:hypothetical protein
MEPESGNCTDFSATLSATTGSYDEAVKAADDAVAESTGRDTSDCLASAAKTFEIGATPAGLIHLFVI